MGNYFSNKTVIIQPKGVPGKFYELGRYMQIGLPAMYTHKLLSMSSMLGVTGSSILITHPLALVAISSSSALFFNGMRMLLGDNKIGRSSTMIGYVLNRPMRGVEIVLNTLVLNPITAVFY